MVDGLASSNGNLADYLSVSATLLSRSVITEVFATSEVDDYIAFFWAVGTISSKPICVGGVKVAISVCAPESVGSTTSMFDFTFVCAACVDRVGVEDVVDCSGKRGGWWVAFLIADG